MKAIGIDIGTTSICGILLDCRSGEIVKSVTKANNTFLQTSNNWEKIQDTDAIINLASDICDSLLCEDVMVIGITGQMHGIVYYDEKGDALSPLYTWQDARGNLPYRKDCTYADFLKLPSGYGTVTDFYNTQNGLRPQAAVGYCTIHDYFAMKLTSRTAPIIHVSNAASFGSFDLIKNCFMHDFTGEITTGFDIIGEYKGIPVSVAIGDNQASVFGALRSDDDILINIGTGSQISVISSEILQGTNIESRPYTHNNYLIVGAALCGGRAYSMLEKFYSDVVYAATGKRINMYEAMDKMIPDGSCHLQVDTRFSGTRKDPSITGSIRQISTENFTPSELRYAFINGIIAELYDMFMQMQVKRTSIVGSGNGIRKNKALIQAAEKVFGAEMKIPAHIEEAAFGAALFAMTAHGNLGTASEIKSIIHYISQKG